MNIKTSIFFTGFLENTLMTLFCSNLFRFEVGLEDGFEVELEVCFGVGLGESFGEDLENGFGVGLEVGFKGKSSESSTPRTQVT